MHVAQDLESLQHSHQDLWSTEQLQGALGPVLNFLTSYHETFVAEHKIEHHPKSQDPGKVLLITKSANGSSAF